MWDRELLNAALRLIWGFADQAGERFDPPIGPAEVLQRWALAVAT